MKSSFAFTSKYRWTDLVFTLTAVATTTVALILLRAKLSTQVIALLYLLPVMLSATRWGLLSALVASLAAFLAFNYFFLTPTHTLVVSNPEEFLVLVVFLIVAILISQSVGAANLHAARRALVSWKPRHLYNLTKA